MASSNSSPTKSSGSTNSAGVFTNWRSKLASSLESARSDLHKSITKSLTAAASTMATSGNASGIAAAGGSKTRLFGRILERAKQQKSDLGVLTRRNRQIAADGAITATIDANTGTARDELQQRLAKYSQLEHEYIDLLEAYELMYVERVHLEELLSHEKRLESIDDMELVDQYLRNLHESIIISKGEISRLTNELNAFKAFQSQTAKEPMDAAIETTSWEHDNLNQSSTSNQASQMISIELQPNPSQSATCADCTKLATKLEHQHRLNQDLEQRLIKLTKGIANLESKSQTNNQAMKELGSSLVSITAERDNLIMEVQEKKDLLFSNEQEQLELKTKLSYLEQQLATLGRENDKVTKAYTQMQEERDGAREEVTRSKDQVKYLKRELTTLQKQFIELEQAQHLQGSQALSSPKHESIIFDRCKDLEEELRTCRIKIAHLEACILDEQQANQFEREEAISKLQNIITEQKHEIEQLQRSFQLLQQQTTQHSALLDDRACTHGAIERGHLSDHMYADKAQANAESQDCLHTPLKALRDECEKLAIENARLKSTFNFEYARNVVLRFLQLPNQRRSLVQVLQMVFKFSPQEMESVSTF